MWSPFASLCVSHAEDDALLANNSTAGGGQAHLLPCVSGLQNMGLCTAVTNS